MRSILSPIRRVGQVALPGGALAALLAGGMCWGQERATVEIAPFRFTQFEGHVLMGYLYDSVTLHQSESAFSPASQSNQKQSQFRTEVFVDTRSYVYHPSLVSLEVGGGPIFDDTRFDLDGSATKSGKTLYNLSARANFLKEKPYRGGFFYEHLNPTQNVGPAQILLTESSRYGLDFSLLAPVTPVPTHLDASSSHTVGSGADQTLDDRVDQFNLRANARLGKIGDTQWRLQGIRQESRSGSLGLPIQESRSSSENLNLDTRLRFGARDEYYLTNTVTFNDQRYTAARGTPTDSRDWRFGLDLRGQHSDSLSTFVNYSLNDSRIDEQSTNLNSLRAGATFSAGPDLQASLTAHGDLSRTTQTNSTLAGINGSGTYRRALPFGAASASYGFGYTWRDQNASATQGLIIGERVTLTGPAFVPLLRPQVVAGSVIVRNQTLTQSYSEGSDYTLSVIGLTTRMQRVIGGNILDGQELLVDYAYDVGGTYVLTQVDNSASLNWSYENYVSTFVRVTDTTQRLASGAPTFQLNPARTLLYGLRADLPLSFLSEDWMVGGSIERENHDEVISPSRRSFWEAYVQAPLPWVVRGDLRLGTRHTRIDYDLNPDQGLYLVAYDFRLSSRLAYGIDVSLDGSRERDTGTPLTRTHSYLSAKARWRVRQFRMTFDLTRTRDTQGETDRIRTSGQLLLRRDF